jgi:probable phosphoglycerate mutase
MLFYYIRHGDPVYDPDGLTPLGQRQAEAVAKRLALNGIDKIYASTSNRAILTATPTAEILKKDIELLDFANENYAWRELTFPIPDGQSWLFKVPEVKDIFLSEEIANMGYKWYLHPKFKIKDYKAGIDRIQNGSDALFESLGYKHLGRGKYEVTEPKYEKVALFAHQGFGICFLSCLLGIPFPLFTTHFDLSHSSVTVIDFNNENGYAYPQVLTLSNDSHIYKEGLPTKYNNEKYI